MRKLTMLVFLLLLSSRGISQTHPPAGRVTYGASLLFQGFHLPFSNPKTYLQNKGLSLSVIYDWTKKRVWQQSLSLGLLGNHYHGTTSFATTSLRFNPIHSRSFTGGIALGAGYQLTGTAAGGWQQQPDGAWQEGPNRKGLFFVPLGVHLETRVFENEKLMIIPTLSYQVHALINYTGLTPVLPQTLISIGSQFKLK